jgi:hypothetical protein
MRWEELSPAQQYALVGELPSGDHARQLVREPSVSNAGKVVGDLFLRSLLIGLGLALVKVPRVIPGAIAASLMVELFVVSFVAAEEARAKKASA